MNIRSVSKVVSSALAVVVGLGVLGGCAVPAPEITELPGFTPVAIDTKYQPKPKTVRFQVIERGDGPEYEQNPELPIALGSSIVISVPRTSAFADDGAARGEGFRTDGYFHEFEQQVEFALIRKGFDLRDRAKFDAKLLEKNGGGNDGIDSEAELINAARDGDVVAQYILRINDIRTVADHTRKIDPLDYPSVVRFARENPGIERSGALDTIEVKMVEAIFNAKLIKVDTGSIAWLGTHRLNSMDLPRRGVEVTITVTPTPENLEELAEQAAEYEARLRKTYTSAQRRYQEATDMSKSARSRKLFAEDYERLLADYNAMLENAPDVSESSYVYGYSNFEVSMEPDFVRIFGGSGPGEEASRVHELELLQFAALEAIEKIEVSTR